MTIRDELDTLSKAISDIKTELINKGQSVSSTDTIVSLADKIDNLSISKYSKTPLAEIIEGTIKYLYDDDLNYLRPYCFAGCTNLIEARFNSLTCIYNHAFEGCTQLSGLILPGNFVKLSNVNAFKNTLIESGSGRIYVKSSLLSTYKADSVWKTFSSQLVAFS